MKSDVPIHFHTHDTSGINAASILLRRDAGVDIADARHRIHERHDQPAEPELARRRAGKIRLATRGLDLRLAQPTQRLLGNRARVTTIRSKRTCKSGTAEVYQHEMPGGQYTNLRQQAKSLHLEDRWQRNRRRCTPRSTSFSATS